MSKLPLLTLLFLLGCKSPEAQPMSAAQKKSAAQVLVIDNRNVPESKSLAEYYMQRRGIPKANLLEVGTGPGDPIPYADYKRQILGPLREKLGNTPGINYIVVMKGVPIRIGDRNGFSVDGHLAVAG